LAEGGAQAARASAKSSDEALFNEFVKWRKRSGKSVVQKPASE
jgi:hypothetical protein